MAFEKATKLLRSDGDSSAVPALVAMASNEEGSAKALLENWFKASCHITRASPIMVEVNW